MILNHEATNPSSAFAEPPILLQPETEARLLFNRVCGNDAVTYACITLKDGTVLSCSRTERIGDGKL